MKKNIKENIKKNIKKLNIIKKFKHIKNIKKNITSFNFKLDLKCLLVIGQ